MAFLQLQYFLSMRSAARLRPTGLIMLLLMASSCACTWAAAADNDGLAAAAPASASSSATSDFVFGSVGIYHRTDAPAGQAVLDFKWDQAPQHLRNQLEAFGLEVVPITSPGKAELTAAGAATAGSGGGGSGGGLHAYVIPPANGPTFYTAAEDMAAVASFVREGGLVVVAEGNQGAESTKAFVQQALGYTGSWLTCREVGSNRHSPLGRLERSERFTSQFLSYSPASIWVPELEDADTVVAHSWCIHDDPGFVSWPLYTSKEERFKVVAQAFGKVGTPGAVVWLGYNWRGGPQRGWGALLATIIQEFALRSLDPSSDKTTTDGNTKQESESYTDLTEQESESELYDSLDPVFEDLEDGGDSLLRRFMTSNGSPGNYPPPPSLMTPPPPPPTLSPPPPPLCVEPWDDYSEDGFQQHTTRRLLSSSKLLYKGAGDATLHYDVMTTCPMIRNQIKVNTDSVPACGDNKGPGKGQTLRQLGSNNVVAIKSKLFAKKSGKTTFCGKKVNLYYQGRPMAAPDGGDFYVWDGCFQCNSRPGVGVSVRALLQLNATACDVQRLDCIKWEVVDKQVVPYSP